MNVHSASQTVTKSHNCLHHPAHALCRPYIAPPCSSCDKRFSSGFSVSPAMLLRPLQPSSCQHGCFRRLVQQQYHISQRAVTARAMPFQLPNPAGPLLNRFNRPQPQQLPPVPPQQQPQLQLPQQQQQQTHNTAVDGPVQHSSAQVVPLSPAQQQPGAAFVSSTSASTSTSTSSASASLRFAKHLANASNGCAPPSSRFESTGWLLFETKRLQAALIGPAPHTAERWVASTEGLQLLEQVYLVGAAIAELGTADGLQPLSSSNGSRAIVSLDYSRLLERYLQQHGHLLAEEFWSGLHAFDDLQVSWCFPVFLLAGCVRL